MLKAFLFWSVCLLVFPFALFSQSPAPGTAPLSEVQLLELPLQDNKALQNAELAARVPGRPDHFATRVEVNVNPDTHGNWEILANDHAVWRLRLRSQGAYSLNLGFTQYKMPEHGQLLLYSPDGSHLQGPFSLADNEDHAQLWTPILYGDEMVLEVQVPVAEQKALQLQLSYVHHDYMGFGIKSAASGSCNLDVICGAADGWGIVDGYRDIIQSAGAYTLNGILTCSGALINNARNDCTPYFLTANHCGVSNNNAPSLVAYWNFQNDVCRQPGSTASGAAGNGQLNQFNTGSIFRSAWFESDFCLVELDDPLDASHEPFLAGWSLLTPADSMIGIHHPGVEEKRISFDFDTNDWTSWFGNIDSTHIVVQDWDIGTTEGGSSGSPLFDQDKRIIGQLHGGGAACGNNLSDEYGWLLKSWDGGGTSDTRLRDWLDPDNSGAPFIDGKSCAFTLNSNNGSADICNTATSSVTYNISVSGGFQGPVTLTSVGLPANANGSFGMNPVQPGASTTLTVSNLGAVAAGSYIIQAIGTDGSNVDSLPFSLAVSNAAPVPVNLTFPSDATTGVSSAINFTWATVANATYDIDIATDSTFTNIVDAATGLGTNNYFSNLQGQTEYYWRVRASNICGGGNFSETWSFSTAQIICNSNSASGLPLAISTTTPVVVNAIINYPSSGTITEVEVLNIRGIHSWIEDLTFTLISPQGTRVTLIDRACFNEDDFDIGFSDNASGTPPCPYNDGLSYPPDGNLADFIGEDPQGNWLLEVEDHASFDGGELLGWDLNICQAPAVNVASEMDARIRVYPVPSTGKVKVDWISEDLGASELEVLGMEGQVLRRITWPAGTQQMELDLHDLADGFYLLRLHSVRGSSTQKLILAR